MRRPSGGLLLAGFATALVTAAVIGGIVVLGPPSEERARRLDERRAEDLRGITGAVDLYWSQHGRLPSALEELSQEPGVRVAARDPETSQPYEYHVLGDRDYELCAQFQRASEAVGTDLWSHGAGRQCFPLKAEERDLR